MTAPGPGVARVRRRAAWPLVAVVAGAFLAGPSFAAEETVPPDRRSGKTVYQRLCASCHGTQGEGIPGSGRSAGPPLEDVDVAYLDLVLRTGRMPLLSESRGVVEPEVTDEQRERLVAWLAHELGLQGSVPEPPLGRAERGQVPFLRNCAQCHGAAGGGGIAGNGVLVPAIADLDPVAITEAARVGPFEMPRFGERVLSDQELADVAAYLAATGEQPATLLGLSQIGRIPAAALTALLALVLLGILLGVSRIGTRRSDPKDEP